MNRKMTLFALAGEVRRLGRERVGEVAGRRRPRRLSREEAVAREQAGQGQAGEAGAGLPEELAAGPAAERRRGLVTDREACAHDRAALRGGLGLDSIEVHEFVQVQRHQAERLAGASSASTPSRSRGPRSGRRPASTSASRGGAAVTSRRARRDLRPRRRRRPRVAAGRRGAPACWFRKLPLSIASACVGWVVVNRTGVERSVSATSKLSRIGSQERPLDVDVDAPPGLLLGRRLAPALARHATGRPCTSAGISG